MRAAISSRSTPLLIVLSMATSHLAHADLAAPSSPPSESDLSEGKRHFEAGLKLFVDKNYAAALLEFQHSYALSGRPKPLLNAAQCLRELKRYGQALDAFENLLAHHGEALSVKERGDVQRAINELRTVIGDVDIVVTPIDATLTIDGRAIGAGPFREPIRVDVGTHTLHFTAPGFTPVDREVAVLSQQHQHIEATLVKESTTAHLKITARGGEGLHVFVDDKDMGAAPWEGDVDSGSHVVAVRSEAALSEPRTINAEARGNLDIELHAQPIRNETTITVHPPTASIAIDGVDEGTGGWNGKLSVGEHKVHVEADGFAPFDGSIAIAVGEPQTREIKLHSLVDKTASGDDATPRPPPNTHRFDGLYATISLTGHLSLQKLPNCPTAENDANCTPASNELGGGMSLRVGYDFSFIALEATTAAIAGGHSATRTSSVPQTTAGAQPLEIAEGFDYLDFGLFAGVGPRITSHNDLIRFTFGTSLGFAYRGMNYSRNVTGALSIIPDRKSSPTAIAPALLFDGGLIIGKTPGTEFTIGAQLWMDFPKPHKGALDDPAPGYPGAATPQTFGSVFKSPEIYIGPTIGLRFSS